MGGIMYESPGGTYGKRKCVLCRKKKYCDDMVDIQKIIQKIQNFDICKDCLKELKIMLEL